MRFDLKNELKIKLFRVLKAIYNYLITCMVRDIFVKI